MIQALREPPKCKNCQKVLEWLPWKNGKPQRPVDPSTKQPCECWKKGKQYADDDPYNNRRWLKAKDYTKCPYCDGYYVTEDGNENHEQSLHKDKKVHRGDIITGDGCFSDEILYHGTNDCWFNAYIEVSGKENVREFAKKHGIKVIRADYLL